MSKQTRLVQTRLLQKYFIIFLCTVLIDRLTKWWALTFVREKDISVLPFINFTFTWNRGVSWGMLNSLSPAWHILLTIFIGAIIVFFVYYAFDQYRQGEGILFETLVISGAASNFFDRIYYGAVIDFIDCYINGWHWYTFNVADACIVIGIGGIIGKGLLCAQKSN